MFSKFSLKVKFLWIMGTCCLTDLLDDRDDEEYRLKSSAQSSPPHSFNEQDAKEAKVEETESLVPEKLP